MSESIFRKKSLDNIKSPENLDQYIQVSHASGWLLLLAVLCLLIGTVIWGYFGKIETKQTAQAFVTDSIAECSLSPELIKEIKPGMTIRVNDIEGTIWKVNDRSVTAKIDLSDGVYNAVIVTEVIKPMSLIFD